jgi:8-oxo-dGTP pyrophosphatase MutT (NUDIX family)
VQQRALDKPNDPGLWDTLVGGMVPARDTLQQALERETWEEAGLRLQQLQALRHRGQVRLRGPSSEVDAGYAIEHLDWYSCVLPEGVEPANQDGEVLQFCRMDARELWAHIARGQVTKDAALLFGEAGLQPG